MRNQHAGSSSGDADGPAGRSSLVNRIVVYTELSSMGELEDDWSRLLKHSAEPVFFQSFDWVYNIAKARLVQNSDHWRLYVATIWSGDKLAGIWPLSLQKTGLCWIVRNMDEPFGQYAGILVDSNLDPVVGVSLIIETLKSQGLASGLEITRVVEGSVLHRQLTASSAPIIDSDHSVYLDLRAFDSVSSYRSSLNNKTRKKLRSLRNRLEREYDIHHEVTEESARVASIMSETYDGRLRLLEDNALTAPAFRDPIFKPLVDGIPHTSLSNQLLAFRLSTEDKMISVQWGFLYQKRYYAYMSARDPGFDRFSAGRIHLGMVIEACWERDIEVVELMAPPSAYKLNWAKSLRRIDDFGVPLTSFGYCYMVIWRRFGLVAARRLFESLPDSMRRRLVRAAHQYNANRISF